MILGIVFSAMLHHFKVNSKILYYYSEDELRKEWEEMTMEMRRIMGGRKNFVYGHWIMHKKYISISLYDYWRLCFRMPGRTIS